MFYWRVLVSVSLLMVGCGNEPTKNQVNPNGVLTFDAGSAESEDGGAAPSTDAASTSSQYPGAIAGQPLTIEQFCQGMHAPRVMWNSWIDRCCLPNAADETGFPLLGPIEEYIGLCIEDLRDAVDDGAIEFHGEFAAACVADRTRGYPAPPATCGRVEQDILAAHYKLSEYWSDSCEATLVGKLEAGDACSDWQCKEGLICRGRGASRMCIPRSKMGGTCLANEDCEDGLFCIGVDASGVCSDKPGRLGSPCWEDSQCGESLQCIENSCGVPRKLGESCTRSDCERPYYCADSKRCESLDGSPNGAKCVVSSTCAGGYCSEAGVCSELCGS